MGHQINLSLMQNFLLHTLKKIEAELENNNLDAAEHLATTALKIDPRNFYTLQLIGVISGLRGDPKSACSYFHKAMKINPNDPKILFNYSKALYELKKYKESIIYIEKSLNIRPDSFEGWLNYGNTLFSLKRYDESLVAYHKSLEINPLSTEAMINNASVLISLERFEEATVFCKNALHINKNLFKAWEYLGECYHSTGDYKSAVNAYDSALVIMPDSIKALNNKGFSLSQIQCYKEAIELFDRAILLNPQLADSWVNKGYCQIQLKQYSEANKSLEIAESIDPSSQYLWVNRGFLYEILNQPEEALLSYQRALLVNSNNPQANLNAGQIYLSKFDFDKGWAGYSSRHKTEKMGHVFLKSSKKIWDCKSSGKNIYLWGEQGIGDQILHSSILSELKIDNSYLIGLDSKLLTLFRRSFPGHFFIDKNSFDMHHYDEHAPLGNLLSVYRPSIESFKKQPNKYLITNENQVLNLKQRLGDSRKIVGISWFSNNDEIGAEKSIPLEELNSLFEIQNYSFIDLQYGDTSKERRKLLEDTGHQLIKAEEIDNFLDLDGLATLIDLCDYVVTISNTTAHLAGALGKLTFLLVPATRGKLWYWHSINNNSMWYPSVRVLKNDNSHSWKNSVCSLKTLLEKIAYD
jgi:tetratricopeptide (TPR) repeat protein